jgi:predicted transcriptional regulator
MPEKNLTTRKHSPAPKVLGTFIKEQTENGTVYKVRYSQSYQPEGHDFTTSFKVLRLAYLFKYHILTKDDIFLYETLQLLCEREIPFTIERLAEEFGQGKATVRLCLDNLENAELLEIVKSDGQGQPNYYILRTPMFERDTIVGDSDSVIGRQNRILKAGHSLPIAFIEDNYLRLIRQVRKNRVRKLRELYRNKEFQKRNKKFYNRLKSEMESRHLTWHKIVKKLGNAQASTFDNLIWRLTKGFADVETLDYWQQFKTALKKHLAQLKIEFDEFLFDYAKDLSVFYDQRRAASIKSLNRKQIEPAAPETPAYMATDEDVEEMREYLTSTLSAVERGETLSYLPKTEKDFTNLFHDALKYLKFSEIQAIASRYFDDITFQKLTVELRQ